MEFTIEEVIAKLDENMPSLSPTATKVIQLANDMNCPPGELTRVIKLDPILSAKVLKLVNSSYFSLPDKIVSLEKAVIMLGLNTIKNLALSAAVLSQVKSKEQNHPFDLETFWKHTLGVGVTAKLLARVRKVPKNILEDYFMAGMMHNMGILVESQFYPEEMGRVIMMSQAMGLVAMEEAELEGLNHCIIGRELGKKWNLSQDLLLVMEHYNNPPLDQEEHWELLFTIHLASAICKNNDIGLVLDEVPVEVNPAVYERLGIPPVVEGKIVEMLDVEITKAMEFLNA